MPNLLAQIVLYSWPLMAVFLFRRLNLVQAFTATILLGYLFIPTRVGYDPPLLPPIDKATMPSLCALIGLWLTETKARQQALRAARRTGTPDGSARRPPRGAPGGIAGGRVARIVPAIVLVMLLSSILTWATNQAPLFYGPRFIAGLAPFDIGSMMLATLTTLLPFFLARRYLRTREAQIDFLKVFVWAGFAYSILALWEARMSPQLNRELYGFFPHSFLQHIRGNGFRPILFLSHGLLVGIFLAMTVLGAATLARADIDGKRRRWLGLTVWLLACLVVSHNLGATLIAVALGAVILAFPMRWQFLSAAFVAVLVLLYPMARGSGYIPAERISALIAGYSAERAASLNVRLINEDILLAKAQQKPLSGWGGWGRNRIYDPKTGEDISITDGAWVMTIGTDGWIGYLSTFGLLCLPVILSALRHRRYQLDAVSAGMVVILAANLIDQIPNASMVAPLWLLAGSVWGRLELASSGQAQERGQRASRPQRHAPEARVREEIRRPSGQGVT